MVHHGKSGLVFLAGGGQFARNNMAPNAQQIQEAIEKDSDFAHEMRVGKILSELICNLRTDRFTDFRLKPVEHGGTYTDYITGKPRQFDYRFTISRDYESVNWAVECKNLHPDCPMVVCGRPRTSEESFHTFLQAEDFYKKGIKVDNNFSIYEFESFVGKSVVRIKPTKDAQKRQTEPFSVDGDKDIYEAWSQAISFCHDIVDKISKPQTEKLIREFILPIVVIPNNSLWIAEYTSDGQLKEGPKQVDECYYYVGHEIAIPKSNILSISHIHFVTLNGLSKMLDLYLGPRVYKWKNIFAAT